MKLLLYNRKMIFSVILITLIAIVFHALVCINIRQFKIAVSSITKTYLLFELIYPLIFIFIGYSIYKFNIFFENSKQLMIVHLLYLIIIILICISSILCLRYAAFIYSFWCIFISLIINLFLSYILCLHSKIFLYLSAFYMPFHSYLSCILFWFYFKNS